MSADDITPHPPDLPDFERVPGLFRGWDLPQVIAPGGCYQLQDTGATWEGCPLFLLFRRPSILDEPETTV